MKRFGQSEAYGVTRLPVALEFDEGAGGCQMRHFFAIDFETETFFGPGGAAKRESEFARRVQRELECGGVTFWKAGVHGELDAGEDAGTPRNCGRGGSVNRHPQAVAGFVVDAVA